jgi:hypothetical protein
MSETREPLDGPKRSPSGSQVDVAADLDSENSNRNSMENDAFPVTSKAQDDESVRGTPAAAIVTELIKVSPELAAVVTARAEGKRAQEVELARTSAQAIQEGRAHDLAVGSQHLSRDVTQLEAYMRAFLAAALVLGTLSIVAYGVIARRPADVLVQYLAPITGLAGLAVGYFFGQSAGGGPARAAAPPRSNAE